jgi:hypothetical protein
MLVNAIAIATPLKAGIAARRAVAPARHVPALLTFV